MTVSVTNFTEEELEAIESKRTIPRFLFFPAGVMGLWFIANPWPSDHWAVQTVWILLTSYILFCWTSAFHETAHQTLCGSRWISIWLGRLLGCVVLVPYNVYRESHIRHHGYLNKPDDFELWPYSDPHAPLWFRRVFVWLDLIFGAVTSPWIYNRTFFHKNSPIQSPKLRRTIRWEYLGVAAFWTAILSTVAWNGAWFGLLKVWVLPHWLAGIYQTTRKLTEHLGMASYDPLLGTRTVIGENAFTRLGTYLNFDIFIHGPHHRHPRMAHNRLKQTMDDYVRENPGTEYPLYETYWQATRQMIPWMFRNPGVGVNRGAPPPNAGHREVDDFVGDVNREVLAETDAAVAS